MAQLVADSDGKISGRFTVSPNIPVGTKLMQFVGSEGNYGEASYTARGIITTEERRQVRTLTDICQNKRPWLFGDFDQIRLPRVLPSTKAAHYGASTRTFSDILSEQYGLQWNGSFWDMMKATKTHTKYIQDSLKGLNIDVTPMRKYAVKLENRERSAEDIISLLTYPT